MSYNGCDRRIEEEYGDTDVNDDDEDDEDEEEDCDNEVVSNTDDDIDNIDALGHGGGHESHDDDGPPHHHSGRRSQRQRQQVDGDDEQHRLPPPSNEKLLCIAFVSFQCFAIIQMVVAWIAGSEAMIGDSFAMLVDAATYLLNWVSQHLFVLLFVSYLLILPVHSLPKSKCLK